MDAFESMKRENLSFPLFTSISPLNFKEVLSSLPFQPNLIKDFSAFYLVLSENSYFFG